MGLKYTLMGLGHCRGTLFGTGKLSLVYLGGIGIHCRGTYWWYWDTPVDLGHLSGTGTPWCDLRHPGGTGTLTLRHPVGLGYPGGTVTF